MVAFASYYDRLTSYSPRLNQVVVLYSNPECYSTVIEIMSWCAHHVNQCIHVSLPWHRPFLIHEHAARWSGTCYVGYMIHGRL